MRLPRTYILDHLFSTWGHIALLRELAADASPRSGRMIARSAQMTHRSCLKSLRRLEQLGIVSRTAKGRAFLFQLNQEHELVRHGLLPLLGFEREFLPRLAKLLRRELSSFSESLILQGPALRKPEALLRDLDLCVVVRDAETRAALVGTVASLAARVNRNFGIRLQTVVVTETEFQRRAKRGLLPVSLHVREGIVLSGKTLRELAARETNQRPMFDETSRRP